MWYRDAVNMQGLWIVIKAIVVCMDGLIRSSTVHVFSFHLCVHHLDRVKIRKAGLMIAISEAAL